MNYYTDNRSFQSEARNAAMRLEPIRHSRDLPGGFWRRFIASIIDAVIVAILYTKPSLALHAMVWPQTDMTLNTNLLWVQLLDLSLLFSIVILYYGWFYANRGATPGKMFMSLRVVDQRTGANLTWHQSVLRETVGKTLSTIILWIGYLIVAFRSDKRALHDMVCGSRVMLRVK